MYRGRRGYTDDRLIAIALAGLGIALLGPVAHHLQQHRFSLRSIVVALFSSVVALALLTGFLAGLGWLLERLVYRADHRWAQPGTAPSVDDAPHESGE